MEMKISDLLDRWTILKMKARFDESANKELLLFDNEYRELAKKDIASAMPGETPKTASLTFISTLLELMESNAKIWELEAAIRQEYNSDPASRSMVVGSSAVERTPAQYEAIGRRSIIIRDLNKIRVDAKKKIDQLFGQIPDIKVNHASQ